MFHLRPHKHGLISILASELIEVLSDNLQATICEQQRGLVSSQYSKYGHISGFTLPPFVSDHCHSLALIPTPSSLPLRSLSAALLLFLPLPAFHLDHCQPPCSYSYPVQPSTQIIVSRPALIPTPSSLPLRSLSAALLLFLPLPAFHLDHCQPPCSYSYPFQPSTQIIASPSSLPHLFLIVCWLLFLAHTGHNQLLTTPHVWPI